VIGVGFLLPRLRNTTAAQPSAPQPFRGFVQDDQGGPLPGVTITAPTLNVPPQITDSNGRFSFPVDLPVGTNFRLVAQKSGVETYTADPPSGDTTFNISLHRVSQKRSP
jgi:carboxypeptidase family protein